MKTPERREYFEDIIIVDNWIILKYTLSRTDVLTESMWSRIGPSYVKGKGVPLQAWTGPESSRNLKFPDFVTTAQEGGRLSALRTGRL